MPERVLYVNCTWSERRTETQLGSARSASPSGGRNSPRSAVWSVAPPMFVCVPDAQVAFLEALRGAAAPRPLARPLVEAATARLAGGTTGAWWVGVVPGLAGARATQVWGSFFHDALARGATNYAFFETVEGVTRVRFQNLELLPAWHAHLAAHGLECLLARDLSDMATYEWGGETGLDIAHRYQTDDSLVSYVASADASLASRELGDLVLSLLAVHDLLTKLVGDRWEEWDVWMNLARFLERPHGRPPGAAHPVDLDELCKKTRWHAAEVAAELGPVAHRALGLARASHGRIAQLYQDASAHDELLYGVREILPRLVVSHWNRWQIDERSRFAAAGSMCRLLDPRRGTGSVSAHGAAGPVAAASLLHAPYQAELDLLAAHTATVPASVLDATWLESREFALGAAARRIEHDLRASWLQCSVHVSRGEASSVLARVVAPIARKLVADGQVDRLFFMRKPPGVRLRLHGVALRQTVVPTLRSRLEAAGIRLEIGPYAPETFQFGGPYGLELAHELFTHDTLAYLDSCTLPEEHRAELVVFSLLLLDPLFRGSLEGPLEEWQAWSHMRLTGRLPLPSDVDFSSYREEFAANERLYRALREEPDSILDSFEGEQRTILVRARGAIHSVATRLREARRMGNLSVDLRTVLPFMVIFHWNRLGLTIEEHRSMSYAMAALLTPTR